MKKILFLFSLFLGACSSNAQTSDFLFKGIPIEGTVSEFSQKLQKQGFQQIIEYKGEHLDQDVYDRITNDMLVGMFINHKALITLIGSQDTHEIQEIIVEFSIIDERELYKEIKRLLARKYNNPEKWTIQDSENIFSSSYKIFDAKMRHEPYISVSPLPSHVLIHYRNPTQSYNKGADL